VSTNVNSPNPNARLIEMVQRQVAKLNMVLALLTDDDTAAIPEGLVRDAVQPTLHQPGNADTPTVKKKRVSSPETRRKISEAAKKLWDERKKSDQGAIPSAPAGKPGSGKPTPAKQSATETASA